MAIATGRSLAAPKADKNNNYTLQEYVKDLSESKKLRPPKDIYLIWMKPNDNSVKKVGQLSPSGKALAATAVANPQEVFNTTEDNVDILYPAGQTILTTDK